MAQQEHKEELQYYEAQKVQSKLRKYLMHEKRQSYQVMREKITIYIKRRWRHALKYS